MLPSPCTVDSRPARWFSPTEPTSEWKPS